MYTYLNPTHISISRDRLKDWLNEHEKLIHIQEAVLNENPNANEIYPKEAISPKIID